MDLVAPHFQTNPYVRLLVAMDGYGCSGWLAFFWHFLTHDLCCFLVPTWLLGIQLDYLFFEGLKTTCKKRIA